MMQLTPDEWNEWSINPVSIALNDWLANQVERILGEWGSLDLSRSTEQLGAQTIFYRGQIEMLRKVTEVTLEDINQRNEE